MGVFASGTDSVPGVRTVAATVSELIYAGPTTQITAHTQVGVTLTATVLTASTWLPPDLRHGSPITLAWPEKAVHVLSNEAHNNEVLSNEAPTNQE
jgi:putative spermidine/putrescine transport system ATP-binding protein